MKTIMKSLKLSGTISLLVLSSTLATAQVKDAVIMNINKKPVYKSEFESIYRKNNKETKITKEALDEYIQLFTNFKLKVTEAEDLGMDTIRKFKDELDGYRKQLAKPYLVDNNLNEALVKEAYERLKTEVRASHILIKVEGDAGPDDTLKAYKRAIMIREKCLKQGFEIIAATPGMSDDPSASKNKGDLGFFTSMQMVYPFENACYNNKIGEISMPIRTRFGYHLIKVTERRPSRGTMRVAHILIASKTEDAADKKEAAMAKANEILQKAKAGEDFGNLARTYSDDQTSGKKGGELPPFGPGRMVPEFENASFNLKNDGDISDLIVTNYGIHIIKRLELKQLEPYDEKKSELKQRIQRDSRSYLPKKSFITKLKSKYKFKPNKKALKPFYTVVDTSVFANEWKIEKAAGLEKPLVKFANKIYTQKDFANYIWKNQRRQKKMDVTAFVNMLFETFVGDELIAYEDTKLEDQYPEFRALMKEYRDGILLFDLTDKKVWTKAVKDTIGLKKFHDQNAQNYMHPQRFDVNIYSCKDKAIADRVKKEVTLGIMTEDELLKNFNKDSQLNLKIEKGLYSKEDKEVLQKSTLNQGLNADFDFNNQIVFIKVNKILAPAPKTLSEARGPVTSDYQNFLEKEWLDLLKSKYEVVVFKEILYSLLK